MKGITDNVIVRFRRKIWRFYKTHRRDLPFRQTTDPYCITVSEIMLQQTQVDRVVPKYESWITRWPDWRSLSEATTQQLLKEWSGLGYNRRAIYLSQLAQTVVEQFEGTLPDDPDTLIKLPGIGTYTSRAILIFAHNAPLATVDTNIRRVILHEFHLPPAIGDRDLAAIASRLMPRGRSRDWHYALMDYSSLALPKQLPHIPPRTRQSKFEGSARQIRGEIIRRLTTRRTASLAGIAKSLRRSAKDVMRAAQAMEREGVIVVRSGRASLMSHERNDTKPR